MKDPSLDLGLEKTRGSASQGHACLGPAWRTDSGPRGLQALPDHVQAPPSPGGHARGLGRGTLVH